MNTKILPEIGERLVVHGMSQKAIVDDVVWDAEVNSWKIILDWGSHGRSRVWAHDENTVWFRWKDSN
jgi:hypothetical protein